jgi:3-oxoacyl-[acyl-carrier protein] reductase
MSVFITGGTKAIGLAIARRFAGDGTQLHLAYRQDEVAAANAVSEIERLGGHVTAVRCAVGSPHGLVIA